MKKGWQIKKHPPTSVSYVIPIAVVGGLCMTLVVPVFTTGIAYSIADRLGIVLGLVMRLIANTIEADFLGGVVARLLVTLLYLIYKNSTKGDQL